MAPTTAVNSFVGAVEEEKMVWGAIVEIEEVADREADGFVTTRAQSRGSGKEEQKVEGKMDISKAVERKLIKPAYQFESKIADPDAAQQMLKRILDIEVPNIKVRDLLSLSGDLCKHMVETTRTQKAPVASSVLVAMPDAIEFSMPLWEVEVTIMGRQREFGLLDEGSEIVILREDLRQELDVELNVERRMWMQADC